MIYQQTFQRTVCRRRRAGVTLVELVVTMLLAGIVMSAVGFVMYDSHKSWSQMFRRATSDVVASSMAARRAFEAVVRKATVRRCVVGAAAESLELYYYGTSTSPSLDQYARFYRSGSELRVDYGPVDPGTFTTQGVTLSQTLAKNVTGVIFSTVGISCSMHLTLDNGRETLTVDCTAVRHNE